MRALSELQMLYSNKVVSSEIWRLIGFWTLTGRNSYSERQYRHFRVGRDKQNFSFQITNALNNTPASAAWSTLQTEANRIKEANWWNGGIHALAGLYSMQADGILSAAIINDINRWIQNN